MKARMPGNPRPYMCSNQTFQRVVQNNIKLTTPDPSSQTRKTPGTVQFVIGWIVLAFLVGLGWVFVGPAL